ncbi:DUF3301 domain-containing protein [Luteibacter pinisoli]|jgi:hypothetical protein|uniref:DUF3301 domain-containing protein n=1 Tax=Luteibacter pinisoli TaxID=2589080 RepID=A0A4Y5Z198_9GAMM|nr:DUF3301 domain-containing protein [Luteibacter pinisoli]QDE38827.1 DUF3301 domain-containing protein [Luteibacter pinisoli]
MNSFSDLFWMLGLAALIASWYRLTRAREVAVRAATALSRRHGLQLLDQSVGLRAFRLQGVDGGRRLERCYAFEVSEDGQSRQPAKIWMAGDAVVSYALPHSGNPELETVVASETDLPTNVISLSDRRRAH